MSKKLSVENRHTFLQQMSEEELDLLVIGGGITGAGIALDASVRGLKVGLVEMQDFAAGTSSRSTKLIHGGLRYLKQGEVNLVREVGRERAILYKNVPHLVIPEKMLLPIIKKGTYGYLASSVGLYVYDLLAGVKRAERRKMLSKDETLKVEPLLRADVLKGGGLYYEYRTDDARLTMEVLKTAVQYGATPVNYAKFEDFIYDNGKVVGGKIKDLVTDTEYSIKAKKIVNAAGPWVDLLRKQDKSLKDKRLHLTKGVHIVVSNKKFPLHNAVYFDHNDGRMVFAIPREKKVYIGTTDTNYKGSLEHPEISQEDSLYLLDAVNGMFPSINLTLKDIESAWAGLRPLIHEDGKSPSELSRKDEIFLSDTGLITIAGGKLTGFRKMAERVVDLVCKQLSDTNGKSYPSCTSDQIALSGGEVGGPEGFQTYLKQSITKGTAKGLTESEAKVLTYRYGKNVDKIYNKMDDVTAETVEKYNLPRWLIAELNYSLNEEMLVNDNDFVHRRTSVYYFDKNNYLAWKDGIEQFIAEYHS